MTRYTKTKKDKKKRARRRADAATQTTTRRSSHCKRRKQQFLTYDKFREDIIANEECVLNWCMNNNLLAKKQWCPECRTEMKLKSTKDRGDGWMWLCRRRVGLGKEHRVETSIRKGSVFEDSKLSLSEILQFIYWWCLDVPQNHIRQQTGFSKHTTCSWHMKCREICEFALLSDSVKIGGKLIFLLFKSNYVYSR